MWKCFRCEELNWDASDWCHKCEPEAYAAQVREQAAARDADTAQGSSAVSPEVAGVDDFEYLAQEKIVLPVDGLPAADVDIKVPQGAAPSILQLELAAQIREHFPRLWTEVLQSLQTTYGEEDEVFYRPADAFSWIGILIPPWEGDGSWDLGHDESTVPSIDNYFWEMGIGVNIPEPGSCYATFEGLKFLNVSMAW